MEVGLTTFVLSAKQWGEKKGAIGIISKSEMNIRDFASINELMVLSNIESLNAELIKKGLSKAERFVQLREMVVYQLEVLDKRNALKAMKKLSDDVYLEQHNRIK